MDQPPEFERQTRTDDDTHKQGGFANSELEKSPASGSASPAQNDARVRKHGKKPGFLAALPRATKKPRETISRGFEASR
ncbi:hypothetical protein AYO47_01340 [Planctomyces sp. SCGC AG-212-M04]|nr:hypothetical protein AYO47_01340 [Planctomyces sp. SCGC AG-212-M04]